MKKLYGELYDGSAYFQKCIDETKIMRYLKKNNYKEDCIDSCDFFKCTVFEKKAEKPCDLLEKKFEMCDYVKKDDDHCYEICKYNRKNYPSIYFIKLFWKNYPLPKRSSFV